MGKDLELGKRIAWLRTNRGLEQKAVASLTGIPYSTYQAYEYGNRLSWKNGERLLSFYKCNNAWLLTGEGEPYPGKTAKYKEVLDPGPGAGLGDGTSTIREPSVMPPDHQDVQGFKISDALMMTSRVLESGTSYATALYLNIVHFDRAVSTGTSMSKCQEELRIQGELIAKMQSRMDDLDNQNKKLQKEIQDLKRTGGDCPPIALETEHAALTGTEDPAM